MLAACGGGAEQKSDWEIQNQDQLAREAVAREAVPAFPPLPEARNLVEFAVDGMPGFRFFVDRPSLSVAEGGVVRYTLVARSAAGAQRVTYEGARCTSAEHRIYATVVDGKWQGNPLPWRGITQRWDVTLHREFFCPQGVPLRKAAEGVQALEAGGHPFSRGFGADPYRVR